MSSPTYETLIADALTEGFYRVSFRVEGKFQEEGRPIEIDPFEPIRAAAEEVAAMMAEYVVESYVVTAEQIIDSCPHCGKRL
jgi:hypothetical protein